MTTIIDLQYGLLASLLLVDKDNFNKKSIPLTLFDDIIRPLAEKVIEYKDKGYDYDLTLLPLYLSSDAIKTLLPYLNTTHASQFKNYLLELRKYRWHQGVALKTSVTEADIRDGLKIFEDDKLDEIKVYGFQDDLNDYSKDLETRITGNVERYKLGIYELDNELLGYILPGELITIGGFPKVGKTNFAMKVLSNAVQSGIPSLYMSCEMGFFSLVDRLISMNSKDISAFDIRNGKIDGDELNQIVGKIIPNKLYDKPGKVVETAQFNLETITKLVEKFNSKFLFIDFVQMFRVDKVRFNNEAEALNEIAKSLKELALSKQIVVFALSQLNSDGATKGSRGLEEKSDVVIRLKLDSENVNVKIIDFEVNYNRFGNTGTTKFAINKTTLDMAKFDYTQQEEK